MSKRKARTTRGRPRKKSELKSESEVIGDILPTVKTGEQVVSIGSKGQKNRVLEEGHIYFFYRPKIGVEHPKSLTDVARFYFLLNPSSILEDDKLVKRDGLVKRLILVPKKALPDPRSKTRDFGFVDGVSPQMEVLKKYLEEKTYTTKTRGVRHTESARACGEGLYEIVEHGANKTTALAYVLEIPEELGDVQNAFNIRKEASYVMTIKNPNVKDKGRKRGLPDKPAFPSSLQEKFKGKTKSQLRFAPVSSPEFLNYQHAEIILIGMTANLAEEFGKVGQALEKEAQQELEAAKQEIGKVEDKVLIETGLEPTKEAVETVKGKWV